VLRSNVTDWSPEDLWRAYIQLTEAERRFTFTSPTSGSARAASERGSSAGSHPGLLLGLRALEDSSRELPRGGLGDEPRQVFEALSEIAMVDVVLPTRSGQVIRKRCISQPTEHQQTCSSGSD